MDRQAERGFQDARDVGIVRAGRLAAEFYRFLGADPIIQRMDAAGFGQCAHAFILHRRTEPFEPPCIEFDPFVAQDLLENKGTDEIADDQSVSRRFKEVVCCDPATGAGHVFDDYGWVAGDVPSHMPGDGARVGIKAAACGETHDEANGLAAKKIRIRCGGARCLRRRDQNRCKQ